MGGGGYVAGPVGLAAVRRRIPLVLTEADSHLGLSNRLLARFARRVCLAFPIEGAHGRALPPDRPARAAARRGPGSGPRPLRPGRGRALRAGLRRLAGRAHDQRGRDPGLSRPGAPGAARRRPPGRRRPEAAGARPALRPARLPRAVRRGAGGRRPLRRARRAGRSSRSRPTAARRSSCPTPTPPPTTRPATRAGWPGRAPPSSSPTRS